MFFWFKSKRIVADAFCTNEDLASLFAIQPAHQPDWIRNLEGLADVPKNDVSWQGTPQIPTIKHCPAIRNLYSKSFSLRAWAQYDLTVRFPDIVHTSSSCKAESHHSAQWGNNLNGLTNCKLISPWLLEEKSGIQWAWTGDRMSQKNPLDYLIVDGIIEYRHQRGTNVNLMLPMPKVTGGIRQYRIMAGDPLVLLTPLTEHDVEVRTHVITAAEYATKHKWVHSQYANYDRGLKIRNEGAPKCPFRLR